MSGAAPKYPYSILGKVAQYPWVHHWKHGRFLRYTAYAVLITYPVFYQLHKAGMFCVEVRVGLYGSI